MHENKHLLCSFIHDLCEKDIHKFNVKIFDSRIKLQKYVFLAKYFDFDLDYNFNLYIHGPYSPDLAKDYYNLSCERLTPLKLNINNCFYEMIKDKDKKWLEVASTFKYIENKNPSIDNKTIIDYVRMAKDHTSDRYIEKISNEICTFIS